MIIPERVLEGILAGNITLAFRRWRRPSVRAGGSLLTSIGKLKIQDVWATDLSAITPDEARRAGYSSREDLVADLNSRAEGSVYCIEFGGISADPRVALRQTTLSADDVAAVTERLLRLDDRADEPWTVRVLELIEAHPALRAADLCQRARQERLAFKINVRKLKALGLTESLEVGYRLSPRGAALLRALRHGPGRVHGGDS
jgi:hypothetical protein